MIKKYNIIQGSDEWKQIRKWIITWSKMQNLIWKPWKKAWDSLTNKLLNEKYIDDVDIELNNFAMQRWLELEPLAKNIFEKEEFKNIEDVWIITNDKYNLIIWCSPDWIINDEEAIEIKCPLWIKTISYFLNKEEILKDYKGQILNYFLTIETLQVLNFMIYNPDIKGEVKHKIYIFERQELKNDLENLENNLKLFIEQFKEKEKEFIKFIN